MKLSDAIRRAIALAESCREYWDRELPKYHPNYPLIHTSEQGPPPPAQEDELRRLLRATPQDELYTLMGVMYLGRGDFNANGIFVVPRDLRKTFTDHEFMVEFILAKGPLAEYLVDGLHELEKAGIDIDHLDVVAA